MASGDHDGAERAGLAEMIAELADSKHRDIAVAESTVHGGMVASTLAAAPRSSRWFRGGVVAYASDVKHRTAQRAARACGQRASRQGDGRGGAPAAQGRCGGGVTGAAGPDGQDGQPPGTVFFGLSDETDTHIEHHCFERNDPVEVCAEAVAEALRLPTRICTTTPQLVVPSHVELKGSVRYSRHRKSDEEPRWSRFVHAIMLQSRDLDQIVRWNTYPVQIGFLEGGRRGGCPTRAVV